jgi:hypothetical protein
VLWARYGAQRLAALTDAGRAQPAGRTVATIHQAEAVERVLRDLQARLGDSRAVDKRKEAEATLRAAREVRHALHKCRREVDGTMERLKVQLRASGAYSF